MTEGTKLPEGFRAPLLSVAATGVALTAAILILSTLRAGWSTAIGGMVATSNLYVMGRIIASRGAGAWRIVGGLKMLLLFGGVWLLLTSRAVDPIPFVVGLGALPIGLVTGSLLRPRDPPEKQ